MFSREGSWDFGFLKIKFELIEILYEKKVCIYYGVYRRYFGGVVGCYWRINFVFVVGEKLGGEGTVFLIFMVRTVDGLSWNILRYGDSLF